VTDFAAEYGAATERVAVFDQSRRARLTVRGKAPGQMLKGVLAGEMPPAPQQVRDGVWAGRATYHAVLTPKGKMISDLWATLLGDEENSGYLLDVPPAGRDPLLAALVKLLPPRLAKLEDVSDRTDALALVGPAAAALLSRLALGLRVEEAELAALSEGEWRAASAPAEGLIVARTVDVWPEAFTVTGPRELVGALRRALLDAGAGAAGPETWKTLRVEAGRPEFGVDMDEETIPTEAGIESRAIDHTKGCYTGQEVIVRIRDRGHVNRRLHLLELGDVAVPDAGSELLAADGSGKAVGRVTSAVLSPRRGGTLALAYVARGVEQVLVDGHAVDVPS
jgi:folate-binding protein YgfZ